MAKPRMAESTITVTTRARAVKKRKFTSTRRELAMAKMISRITAMTATTRATSWPSSHPAVLLAFVTVTGRNLELSRTARTAFRALAAAVGISRTYVGVHYPADVVGGLLLGQAVADAVSKDAR